MDGEPDVGRRAASRVEDDLTVGEGEGMTVDALVVVGAALRVR
jgi:hypothetical protein